MIYTIEVVRDACLVLDTFLENHAQSLSEVTKRTGLNKGKVFRILATLEECRFLRRLPSGDYWLHVHFLEFGRQIMEKLDIVEVSKPILDWLVKETGESAFVSIIDGTEALCVATQESPQRIRLSAEVGRRLPLYAGATPIILLAFASDEERRELLSKIELKPLTPETITDKNKLIMYLDKIREQGFVVTGEDLDAGARGVAAPIRDLDNQVVASLSVSGVTSRFTEERVSCYVQLVLEGAARISEALGHKSRLGNYSGIVESSRA
jgi:IclR family KDG regulon transcriptional repressor